MATVQKDLTGMRFGRLTAIRNTGEREIRKSGKKVGYVWECRCDCGNTINVEISRLTCGVTKSCGCLHSDIISKQMKKEDLTGKRFGNLTVIKWLPMSERNEKYKYYPYLCLCECGNYTQAKSDDLKKGNKVSCGCVHYEYSHKKKITAFKHGGSDTRLYHVWATIKDRCYNQNNKSYADYGGRGIIMCDEWKNNFQSFRDWAYSTDYDENAEWGKCTIDREDNNGNYCPENCRWADMKIQRRNQRYNKRYEYNGEMLMLIEISERTNIPLKDLSYAVSKEMNIQDFVDNYTPRK